MDSAKQSDFSWMLMALPLAFLYRTRLLGPMIILALHRALAQVELGAVSAGGTAVANQANLDSRGALEDGAIKTSKHIGQIV